MSALRVRDEPALVRRSAGLARVTAGGSWGLGATVKVAGAEVVVAPLLSVAMAVMV